MPDIPEINKRVHQIRLDFGWSTAEMAAKVGLSQESISNWEAGRTKITLDRMQDLSAATGLPLSYILGEKKTEQDWTKPISKESLGAMHRKPVWTRSYGWALVNYGKKALILTDGNPVPFEELNEDIFGIPPALSISLSGFGSPLLSEEIPTQKKVWLEPIGTDTDLNAQLRGWYHPFNDIFVANELGIRFYLDTYGAKWLAFSEEI